MILALLSPILYIFSLVLAISGFYFYKKSDKAFNGICWLPVTFILSMCFNALISSLVNLINIPVNIFTMSIFNILIGLFFWIKIVSLKRIQKYIYFKFDIIFTLILIFIVVIIASNHFGPDLQIHYETSDPSVHLKLAMDVVNTGKVSGMFFSQLNNAFILEIFSPIVSQFSLYKIFILIDVFMLFLSGFIFYALIRRYFDNKFLNIVGAIVTIVYTIGYPLNNMLFGFVYLGMSVSVIALVIFLLDIYINNEIENNFNLILIMLSCLGVFLCYMLFMPVVYLSVFICIIINSIKIKQKLLIRNTFVELLIVFLIPCLLGLYYNYFQYFINQGVDPGQAISSEGYIYRDLFSNFVIFLPFAVYGFIAMVKNRKWNITFFVFPALIIFIGCLLSLGLNGKVSSYYYFKNYYFLWLIIFYLFFYGINYISKQSKSLIISYISIWGLLAYLSFSQIDDNVNKNALYFDPTVKSGSFFDLFTFNTQKVYEEIPNNSEKLLLYRYVFNNIEDENQQTGVPFVGNLGDCFWYEAITNERVDSFYSWKLGEDIFISKLKNGDFGNYAIVLVDSDIYNKNIKLLNSYSKIFFNNSGFIIKLK